MLKYLIQLKYVLQYFKRYEAMQLVNLMDKMTRTGLIQPCR